MKTALTLLIIILAVLATGCTTTTPAAAATPVPTPAVIPTLMGTWTGTWAGYDEGAGYTETSSTTMSMVVTEQHGRIFSGHLTFRFNNTEMVVPMAGILGSDGRTFSMVEDGNGYSTGEIIGSDQVQLTHMDDSKPISVALDMLKKE